MKVKFWCDSGANIHSCQEAVVDIEKDWGITDDEWAAMTDDEKRREAEEWAYNCGLEIGYEEIKD